VADKAAWLHQVQPLGGGSIVGVHQEQQVGVASTESFDAAKSPPRHGPLPLKERQPVGRVGHRGNPSLGGDEPRDPTDGRRMHDAEIIRLGSHDRGQLSLQGAPGGQAAPRPHVERQQVHAGVGQFAVVGITLVAGHVHLDAAPHEFEDQRAQEAVKRPQLVGHLKQAKLREGSRHGCGFR